MVVYKPTGNKGSQLINVPPEGDIEFEVDISGAQVL